MREGDWCLQSCWQQPKLGQNKRRKSCSYLCNVSGTNYDVSAAPTSTKWEPSCDAAFWGSKCCACALPWQHRSEPDLMRSFKFKLYTFWSARTREKWCKNHLPIFPTTKVIFEKKNRKIWSFWHWFDLGPDWYLIGHMLYDVHRATCILFFVFNQCFLQIISQIWSQISLNCRSKRKHVTHCLLLHQILKVLEVAK